MKVAVYITYYITTYGEYKSCRNRCATLVNYSSPNLLGCIFGKWKYIAQCQAKLRTLINVLGTFREPSKLTNSCGVMLAFYMHQYGSILTTNVQRKQVLKHKQGISSSIMSTSTTLVHCSPCINGNISSHFDSERINTLIVNQC